MPTIAAISAETGIAKEVLRKWEARYGFPVPQRDSGGHRLYTSEQTERLKLIKKLIDSGLRPGQVVPLDHAQALALLAQIQQSQSTEAPTPSAVDLIKVLQSKDASQLREKLTMEISRLGLEQFILDVMPSLNILVGDAWAKGKISVRDEHVYTEIIQGVIREQLVRFTKQNGTPRVLVTTPVGELHTLGILMVEAVVKMHGGDCISLGAQTPLEEICGAVDEYRIDIAGLSFSESFPKKKIAPLLKELRGILPTKVELWAGGNGTKALDHAPRGVRVMSTLRDVIAALHKVKK
jgi:methanogenic corrinoid protein MtbC1